MYDHVGLTVNDVAASVRFYQSALAGLGNELVSRNESGALASGRTERRHSGSVPASDRQVTVYTSRFKRRIGPRSSVSIPTA